MKYYKIFFSVFGLIFLIVPLFRMDVAKISEQENRTLAKFPEISKNGQMNSNYGKEFETWLGDRFWGRDKLINARFQMLYKINGRIENDKAFIGDDGWMFSKSKTVNRPSIEKQRKRIEKDIRILKAFSDKFKRKSIPIYLVLLPEREILYQKYWEKYYKLGPLLDYEGEIVRLLKGYPNIKVLPIKEKINDLANRELVFHKDDEHLTSLPRQVIIKTLFQQLKKDYFPKDKYVLLNEEQKVKTRKHTANIAAQLGFLGKVELNEKIFSLSLNLKSIKIEEKEYVVQKDNGYKGITLTPYVVSKNKDAPILKEGIFVGPCYTETAYDVLSPLFSTSKKIRLNVSEAGKDAIKYMKEKMKSLYALKENSAVIIMVINEDYFHTMEIMGK